jgi:hypothetical protein
MKAKIAYKYSNNSILNLVKIESHYQNTSKYFLSTMLTLENSKTTLEAALLKQAIFV